MNAEYVFGYGSLVVDYEDPPGRDANPLGYVTDLIGFARKWGVAMDNTRDIAGYKYYTLEDGSRPDVFVAYLDIVQDRVSVVNGVCTPVHHELLDELDRRERNYERVDVTAMIANSIGRTWAYLGSDEGRARLDSGLTADKAVINRGYLSAVENGFQRLGMDEYAAAASSLQPGPIPILDLTRHDIPNTIEREQDEHA